MTLDSDSKQLPKYGRELLYGFNDHKLQRYHSEESFGGGGG